MWKELEAPRWDVATNGKDALSLATSDQ